MLVRKSWRSTQAAATPATTTTATTATGADFTARWVRFEMQEAAN